MPRPDPHLEEPMTSKEKRTDSIVDAIWGQVQQAVASRGGTFAKVARMRGGFLEEAVSKQSPKRQGGVTR